MKILLLKNIPKLGKVGEIKQVSDGYAQNYLIPKGLAQVADTQTVKSWKASVSQIEKQEIKVLNRALALKKRLQGYSLTVPIKASNQGHLFASLKREDVLSCMSKDNISFDPKWMELPIIKELGEYDIKVKFPTSEHISFKIKVVSQ